MAASLIEQLQADALQRSVPITDLLRKAKAAATKLGQKDFSDWIELEMSGYPDGNEVPQYRRLHADLKFLNPVRGWCPIIDGGHTRDCRPSIGELAALAEAKGNSTCIMGVGREITERIGRQIGFDVDVKSFVSRASIANIIEAVRNTILDWALKLEAAGVRGDGLSFSPQDADRAKHVTINIGSIGNAVGLGSFGDGTTITATQTLNANALAEGVRALISQIEQNRKGLPNEIQKKIPPVLADLRATAVASKPDAGKLRKGLESLKSVMEIAAGDLLATGIHAAVIRLLSGS